MERSRFLRKRERERDERQVQENKSEQRVIVNGNTEDTASDIVLSREQRDARTKEKVRCGMNKTRRRRRDRNILWKKFCDGLGVVVLEDWEA